MTSGTAHEPLADAMSFANGLLRPLTSSALAGAATGSRSMTGVAGLTLAARAGAGAQPDRTLARPWVKATAALAAAGELAADQLPSAPSRLSPPGLASRVAAAAAAGVIIARRGPGPGGAAEVVACVAAAAGTAVATAWLGVKWRAWASDRFGRDWIGASLEDAVAIGVATAAATLSG
jgi:uncharacterized membrane protein